MPWVLASIAAFLAAVARLRKLRVKVGECWTVYGTTNLPNVCSPAAEETFRRMAARQGAELVSWDCHAPDVTASVRYTKNGFIRLGRLQIPRELAPRPGGGFYYVEGKRAERCAPEPRPAHPSRVA